MAEEIPLVFIHGLKGSSLVDENNATYYINLWQGLGLSAPNLALPMEWEDGKQKTDKLRAGKIFDKVAHLDVYGPFLRYIESLKRPTYTFAYDWRRDLNETVEKYQAFLREIHLKHKSKVQIVAHSMGGLITLASVNTHEGVLVGNPVPPPSDKDTVKPSPADGDTVDSKTESSSSSSSSSSPRVIDFVHSIVFAGCPFRTGVGFLRDLMVGVPNGYNHRILSPSVLSTFPSIYTFFPTQENSQILDAEGNRVPIDFYDAKDWLKYKMGIFHKLSNPSQEQLNHLEQCTTRAKLLRSKLVALDIAYPPIAVLASHKHPTEQKFKLINGDLDFKNVIVAMGDDRIINATPPDGIPNTEYETDESHASLLNDLPTVTRILSDLFSKVN